MKEVCVVGYGTMGKGIAQVFAQNGYKTHIVGYNLKKVQKAKEDLKKSLDVLVKKGKFTAQQVNKILNNIHPCLGEDSLKRCDLIIEAIPENFKLKKELFNEKSKLCKTNAIIATNTSSLSINELAKNCKNPQRFIGIHFFNPVPIMKLVEVVKGKNTSEETYKKVIGMIKSLGKEPVTSKDYPGFIVNSLLIPFINDSVNLLDKNIATKEDIDKAVKLGLNHPMGPLELADFIGLDVVLDICKQIKKKPSPLLVKLVNQGKLGRKSGEGFYSYKK